MHNITSVFVVTSEWQILMYKHFNCWTYNSSTYPAGYNRVRIIMVCIQADIL